MATETPAPPDLETPDLETPEGARSQRSDAKRNHDKVLAAAREAFAETGVSTSLEAIARRAEVGIGTLYRHFPTRQALLEAVYLDEVRQLCSDTAELTQLPPWESFVAFLHRLAEYLATKKALANELLAYVEPGAEFFQTCRGDLFLASQPILDRAQQAGEVRLDTSLTEVVQLVGGIAKIDTTAPGQREHILDIALDGLRHRAH